MALPFSLSAPHLGKLIRKLDTPLSKSRISNHKSSCLWNILTPAIIPATIKPQASFLIIFLSIWEPLCFPYKALTFLQTLRVYMFSSLSSEPSFGWRFHFVSVGCSQQFVLWATCPDDDH